MSIGKWAGLARQNVAGPLVDLEDWGYLEKIRRGRTTKGKFKTMAYRVIYSPSSCAAVIDGGDTVHVMTGDDNSVSPPGVADSDHSESDLQGESEGAFCGRHHYAPANRCAPAPAKALESGTAHASAIEVSGSSINSISSSASSPFPQQLRALARQKVNDWEHSLSTQAEQRICNALFKDYLGEALSEAMAAFSRDNYEHAVELEIHKRWAGVNYLRRKIKKAIRS